MLLVNRLAPLLLVALIGSAACSAPASSAVPASSSTASTAASRPSSAASAKPPATSFDSSRFKLTSSAFKDGDVLPVRNTCNGESLSPPLAWEGAPAEAASFVLIMDDYSNQVTHWVVYNVPASASGKFNEDFGRASGGVPQAVPYMAACPHAGHPSTYYITLFALSEKLTITNPQTQLEIENAMEGKVLAQAQITTFFSVD